MSKESVTTPETITGRRDFDVVAFTDYAADMKEQSDRVLGLHQHYQQQIKQRDRLIWALIKSAGGKIVISKDAEWHMADKQNEIMHERELSQDVLTYWVGP